MDGSMPATQHPIQRVLVVDDNQLVTRSLATLLRDEGYDPVIFQAGQPALDYLNENCPDVALIDVHLPDLSGLEVSRRLREKHGQSLPIIIFSADTSMETLRALAGVGATYFLGKPVDVSLLMARLKEWTAIRTPC
jgi:DNA-binding response OmpR family regulator